ncbi:lysine N(6)-hydroxylase/L-ornithine N(5)-oxygenase family protein [Corynebacterium sp.]|uniref:lysine N(6)-hydroxylase/L-ornithine N(5)-oxygenase family protein n=1 Tax=Corynebacterium sp. TaxID=1720 RepID=UPI002A913872|nr:SidA/IucD/PvdA family monooxygenase [Corynebacterium sp.]MDY5786467.1 SidA/IucD/PvdA family monooxygenase [Corynebacterium sp.]
MNDTPDIFYTFDIVGVGIGPFNLGLAALAQPLVDTGELTAAFFDQRPSFRWHPGMMLDNATIQVPFLADLVTMADPTSEYSFLNYLKVAGRLHRFYIRESFFPLRSEYSDYCAWVDSRLSTTHWGTTVISVSPAPRSLVESTGARWLVELSDGRRVLARHVVSGVGTEPFVPTELAGALHSHSHPIAVHSANYLDARDSLLTVDSVTVIGSGQSAAEIYADLLPRAVATGKRVDWLTRSPRFFPMEYTKLTLEMTSPEYAAYFRSLPSSMRDDLNWANRGLYNGISAETINSIYDTLYQLDLSHDLKTHTSLRAGVSVRYQRRHGDTLEFELEHLETATCSTYSTQAAVLCTGYKSAQIPDFLEPSRHALNLDVAGRFDLDDNFAADGASSLFVLNADEHLISLNGPDLGMGPWRNSIVLRAITGREIYPVEQSIAFQDFGGFTS